ncbi:MAG TPA: hypothetical protein VI893_04440 [Thermoplasmata archaeon]|nr:hypothetical protein [Thermoplasmata archaeon]
MRRTHFKLCGLGSQAKFAMSFDEYREQVKLDKAGGDDCCSS